MVAFTTPGDRPISAAYAGDANFVGSSALGTHRVRYNTTTTITTSRMASISVEMTFSIEVCTKRVGS